MLFRFLEPCVDVTISRPSLPCSRFEAFPEELPFVSNSKKKSFLFFSFLSLQLQSKFFYQILIRNFVTFTFYTFCSFTTPIENFLFQLFFQKILQNRENSWVNKIGVVLLHSVFHSLNTTIRVEFCPCQETSFIIEYFLVIVIHQLFLALKGY